MWKLTVGFNSGLSLHTQQSPALWLAVEVIVGNNKMCRVLNYWWFQFYTKCEVNSFLINKGFFLSLRHRSHAFFDTFDNGNAIPTFHAFWQIFNNGNSVPTHSPSKWSWAVPKQQKLGLHQDDQIACNFSVVSVCVSDEFDSYYVRELLLGLWVRVSFRVFRLLSCI